MTPRIVQVPCERCAGRPGDRACLECSGTGEYAAFASPPDEGEVLAAMPSEHDDRPVVAQLFTPKKGEDPDATVQVPCMICGHMTEAPKCLVDFVRIFNRNEIKKADATALSPYPHRPDPIPTREIVICDNPACLAAKRAEMAAKSREYFRLLDVYTAQMKRGELSSDGETFMRRNGYAESVDLYRKEQDEKQERADRAAKKRAEKPAAAAPASAREKSAERPLELDLDRGQQHG